MASLILRRVQGMHLAPLQRWYSLAAVPLTKPVETATPAEGSRAAPEDVKVSQVNGYTVASLENYSTLSTLSVFMRAGSRYESYHQQGLTHLLRNCAFTGNASRTSFGIARETDLIGATLDATSTREHLIYSSKFTRGNMQHQVGMLGEVMSRPQFKPWEVDDRRYTLSLELAQAEATPTCMVMEGLHKMAYRNGLCNPLYCPSRNISKFNSADLQDYANSYFIPGGTIIVGVGVDHEELVAGVREHFSTEGKPLEAQKTPQAEYVGGAELRIPCNSPHTTAAVVSKGVSLTGAQGDLVAAGVLQHVLGAEPQGYLKWSSNPSGRLHRAGALATDSPFTVSSLNVSYSDSGLFGFMLTCQPADSDKLLKATAKETVKVAGGDLTEEDVTRAKNQLKTRYLMNMEARSSVVADIANQVACRGSYTPMSDTLAQVDKVTKDDVVRLARLVCGSKACYVSHGDLSSTPRLDQLLVEISLK